MIDINLWKELFVFEKHGTLSKAAEELFISQPALSRSMNKLEEELGVTIFSRSKNKLTLNETGKLAAIYAREIIRYEENAIASIRAFDKKNRTISIGSCAPMPLADITEAVTTIYSGFTISSEINHSEEIILDNLINGIYDISICNHEIKNPEFLSIKAFFEKLYLVIDKSNSLAKKEGIYLSELNNKDILLYSEIGFWYELLKSKAPNANLLIQHDDNTFNTLINTTSFPSFATNKSISKRTIPDFKTLVPILDKEATVDYYCVILKDNYKKFSNLFKYIKNNKNFNI